MQGGFSCIADLVALELAQKGDSEFFIGDDLSALVTIGHRWLSLPTIEILAYDHDEDEQYKHDAKRLGGPTTKARKPKSRMKFHNINGFTVFKVGNGTRVFALDKQNKTPILVYKYGTLVRCFLNPPLRMHQSQPSGLLDGDCSPSFGAVWG